MKRSKKKKLLGLGLKNPEARWSIRKKRIIHLMHVISNYRSTEIEQFARRRTF